MTYEPPAPYGPDPHGGDSYGWDPFGPHGAPYGAGGWPPVPPQPPPYSPYPAPQNNGLAVAALITGLAGFCCLLAPVAVGLGIGGLSVARRTGVGRAMSIAGIVLGVAWLLVYLIVVAVILSSLPGTF
ncbi:MAG TPA: DUF4190 domain-containing protein [Jatrophihabitans sp.]|nr:DUF4190 domain-containing protein [Jatrophihabitans sp.]